MKLFTVDLKDLKPNAETVPINNEIKPPHPLASAEHIISVVKWVNNDTLFASWMNRVQNRAILQTCVGSECKPVSMVLVLIK